MQTALQLQSHMVGAIVLGLSWDGQVEDCDREVNSAADLDAICELRDGQGRLLELIGPGRLQNVSGSVMHTGDSRTGASAWDDERIFVFVDALPCSVHSLVFLIESKHGAPFSEVGNPSCHVSDCITEQRFVTVQLDRLGTLTKCTVAILRRTAYGWKLISDIPDAFKTEETL